MKWKKNNNNNYKQHKHIFAISKSIHKYFGTAAKLKVVFLFLLNTHPKQQQQHFDVAKIQSNGNSFLFLF